MLTAMLRSVCCLFCHHEWMARSEQTRLYVECVRCLATSRGIDIRRVTPPMAVLSAPAAHGSLPTDRLAA